MRKLTTGQGEVYTSLRNGVLFVLAWVACLRGWCASVGDVGGVLAWMVCVACLHAWHATVGGVGGVGDVDGMLAWVAS